jgi:hypothetical protein
MLSLLYRKFGSNFAAAVRYSRKAQLLISMIYRVFFLTNNKIVDEKIIHISNNINGYLDPYSDIINKLQFEDVI